LVQPDLNEHLRVVLVSHASHHNVNYIRQVNGVKLADIMFSLLCVCARARTQSHWYEWAE